MTDVFLSYSREDQATARRFAEALEAEGFSVWWDQALSAGEAFDRVTEKALDEARAVVVLWSKHSADSNWVRAEATQAHASGRLVPAMIEPCRRPIMFELTHTADLVGWNGADADPRWRSFIDGLRRFTGQPWQDDAPAATGAAAREASRSRARSGLIIGGVAVLLAAAGIFWALHSRNGDLASVPAADAPAAPVAQSGVTLAVLPFANLSPDPAQEYFADGLTEEILNQLAQIPALRLTGRTSSFSFKDRNEDLRQIGEKLGVAHLLEGSVRKDGDQLRITAQLIRAADGTHQWSKTYDRNLESVFAVQDEIAKDVAQALSVKLDVATLNRAQGGTTNVEAYVRYLQWREFELSERRDVAEARGMVQRLREAVALDPGFALAWDGLAQALTRLAERAQPAESAQLRAEAATARAHVADVAPDNWIVQRERAYALFAEGKWTEAIALARQIMESSPRSWEHTYPYTNLIFSVGRVEETEKIVRELQAIEPLAMYMSRDLQWTLTALGRYEDAEAEYQRSRSLTGNHAGPDLVRFLRMLSREDTQPGDLRAQYRQMKQSAGGSIGNYMDRLEPFLDDRTRMRALLREEFAARPNPLVRLSADALGDSELAMVALDSMWEGRSPDYEDYWDLWIVPYSGLRASPGFKERMREVGLVDYWRQTGEWGDFCRPLGEDDFECN